MDNPLHALSPAIVNSAVFAVIPATGSMRDWSLIGAANTALVAANTWVVKNNVLHLRGGWNATNNYAYDVRQSLDGDAWTCFASGNPFTSAPNSIFFRAYDGVGQKFSWFYSVPRLRVYNGTIFSNLDLNLTDHTSVATCSDVNGIPQTYVDGVFFGAHNLAITLSPITQDLRTNHSDFVGTAGQDITSLLMFDRQLSVQEILQLHSWSRKLKTPALHQRTAGFPPVIGIENNLRGIWDFGRLDGGAVRDFARTPHHGTVTGGVTTTTEAIGKAGVFDGSTGYVTVGATGTTCRTFELIVWPTPYGPELIVDGDMELSVPTPPWTPVVSATLTKETGAPHGGLRSLRIAYNGSNYPGASQTILTVGKTYRALGWGHGDAAAARPYAQMGSGNTIWEGTTAATWQTFDATVTATSVDFFIKASAIAAGYCEFDDVSVRQLLPDQKIIDLDGGTRVIEMTNSNFVATGFTTPTVWLDGVAGGTGVRINQPYHVIITTATGVSVSNLLMGKVGANFFGGTIKAFTMYEDEKDATWIARRYRQFARIPTHSSDPDGWYVSFANATSGQLSNTPYTIASGTWKVVDDGAGKAISCIATGVLTKTEATGHGGSLQIRRAATTPNLLYDAADATSVSLITGDKIGAHNVTAKPVHQNQNRFTWTTADTTQSWTIRVTNGKAYWIDWGDNYITSHTGNGADQVVAHTYTVAGLYCVTFAVDSPTDLLRFQLNSNGLIGSIPSLTTNTALAYFHVGTNQLTGSIPSLTTNTALETFYAYANQLTGSIPSLTTNTALVTFSAHTNQLTGSIPSLTTNTALAYFHVGTNQLTGYTSSTLAPTLTTFRAEGNKLDLAAVDQILADFTTGAGGRPAAGTINLSDGTNAAPTPAVKAACVAALPGWTITTN